MRSGDSNDECHEGEVAPLRELCEDDAIGEWELCLPQERRLLAEVVAMQDCETLFISRTVYALHLRPFRTQHILRQGALEMLLQSVEANRDLLAAQERLDAASAAADEHRAAIAAAREALLSRQPSLISLQGGESNQAFARPGFRRMNAKYAADFAPGDCRVADQTNTRTSTNISLQEAMAVRVAEAEAAVAAASAAAVVAERALAQLEVVHRAAAMAAERAREAALAAVHGLLSCSSDAGAAWSLLQQLPRKAQRSLCGRARVWRAGRGELLFREGDEGAQLLIVIRGEVALFRQREEDEEADGAETMPMEVLRHVPGLARQAVWRHGVPEDQDALNWLDSVAQTCPKNASRESEIHTDADDSLGYSVAHCLLDVVARRWKCMPVPLLGSAPRPEETRTFVKSGKLEWELLGLEIEPPAQLAASRFAGVGRGGGGGPESQVTTQLEGEARYESQSDAGGCAAETMEVMAVDCEEDSAELGDLGELIGTVREGMVLDLATPGLPDSSPPRAHSAVAVAPVTDLLVIDAEAVAEVLLELRRGLPDGRIVAEALRARPGPSERTPQDQCMLDALLAHHEFFAGLEHRARRGVGHAAELLEVSAGEILCWQGEKAAGFFQVLSGSLATFVARANLGVFDEQAPDEGGDNEESQHLLPILLAGEGSAFGEGALLGEASVNVQTIRVEEDAEILWVKQQAYEEVVHDWWGEQAARRRALTVLSLSKVAPLLDISNHVVHSGSIQPDRGIKCLVSFPGRFAKSWDAMLEHGARMSTACVYLADSASGLGQHVEDAENPANACYCRAIYGERDYRQFGYLLVTKHKHTKEERRRVYQHAKATNALVIDEHSPELEWRQAADFARQRWEEHGRVAAWGCKWFADWQQNVERAVALHQKLMVCYVHGQKGMGKVAWEALSDPVRDPWGGQGLSGSQKVEVAYLDRLRRERGAAFDYEEVDVGELLSARLGDGVARMHQNQECQDLEAVAHVLSSTAPWFRTLRPMERLHVTRQAVLCKVPLGSYLFRDTRETEPPPLCVVLSGCIGRYPMSIESAKVDAHPGSTGQEAETGLEPGLRHTDQAEDEVPAAVRRLRRLRSEAAVLSEQQARNPLGAPLHDKLRLCSLQRRMRDLEAELGDSLGRYESGVFANPGQAAGNLSRSVTTIRSGSPSGPRCLGSMSGPSLGPAHEEPAGITSEQPFLTEGLVQEDGDELESAAAVQQLAGIEALPGIGGSDSEYVEGQAFGSWTDREPPKAGAPGARAHFRAHTESEVLMLTQAAYDIAMQIAAGVNTAERAAFLRKWLPPKVSSEMINRMVPLFAEETRPKGSVLVRKDCQAERVFLVTRGHCRCILAAPAAGLPASGAGGSGNVAGQGPGCGSGEEGSHEATTSGGTLPSDVAAGPGSDQSPLACLRAAEQTLGILEEGQFVGLFSTLLREPEPVTVAVSSPEAQLLALRPASFAKFSCETLEALSAMLRARHDWHMYRSLHVAGLPGQLAKRMEGVRTEVQRSKIPLMLDSPFLRRQGQGIAQLEAICNHFGSEVHPETEWIYAPQSRGFFQSMQLSASMSASASSVADLPPIPVAGSTGGQQAVQDVGFGGAHVSQGNRRANSRFYKFHSISCRMREEVHSPNAEGTKVGGMLAAPQVPKPLPPALRGSSRPPPPLAAEDPSGGLSVSIPFPVLRRKAGLTPGLGTVQSPQQAAASSTSAREEEPLMLKGGSTLAPISKAPRPNIVASRVFRRTAPFVDTMEKRAQKQKQALTNYLSQQQHHQSPWASMSVSGSSLADSSSNRADAGDRRGSSGPYRSKAMQQRHLDDRPGRWKQQPGTATAMKRDRHPVSDAVEPRDGDSDLDLLIEEDGFHNEPQQPLPPPQPPPASVSPLTRQWQRNSRASNGSVGEDIEGRHEEVAEILHAEQDDLDGGLTPQSRKSEPWNGMFDGFRGRSIGRPSEFSDSSGEVVVDGQENPHESRAALDEEDQSCLEHSDGLEEDLSGFGPTGDGVVSALDADGEQHHGETLAEQEDIHGDVSDEGERGEYLLGDDEDVFG